MSSDSIDIRNKDRLAKHCPYCGSNNVVVWDFMIKCRKCYRFSAAIDMDIDEGFGSS